MKLGIQVTYLDGSSEHVVARFADFVDFEATWRRSVARFETELFLTDIGWLAWCALTREKRTSSKWSPDFKNSIDSVEVRDAPGDNPNSETTAPTG